MQMIHNKLARFIYMRRHGKIRIQPRPEVPNSHHAMLSLRAGIIYIRKGLPVFVGKNLRKLSKLFLESVGDIFGQFQKQIKEQSKESGIL